MNSNQMTNQQTDVVIITALDKERDAVLRYLDSPQQIQSKNRIVYKSNLPHDNAESFYQVVLLCPGKMGNVEAGIATTQAIDVWNPNLIILVGIMGGVENGDERYLGDLIISEQIVGYEQSKITDIGIERRDEVLRPDYTLFEAAKNFPFNGKTKVPRPDGKNKLPSIHTGIVASGEKVIADTQTIPELQSNWSKLIGVEMESYGAALAAYKAESRPRFLMVKSICDWANPDKNDKWQDYAADVAAVFVINLLKSKPFISQADKHQPQIKKPLHYTGKIKIQFCRHLGADWQDLADYFDIPAYHCSQFSQGRECQAIWEWLENRNKLYGLKEALDFLERQDLVELLNVNNKVS